MTRLIKYASGGAPRMKETHSTVASNDGTLTTHSNYNMGPMRKKNPAPPPPGLPDPKPPTPKRQPSELERMAAKRRAESPRLVYAPTGYNLNTTQVQRLADRRQPPTSREIAYIEGTEAVKQAFGGHSRIMPRLSVDEALVKIDKYGADRRSVLGKDNEFKFKIHYQDELDAKKAALQKTHSARQQALSKTPWAQRVALANKTRAANIAQRKQLTAANNI